MLQYYYSKNTIFDVEEPLKGQKNNLLYGNVKYYYFFFIHIKVEKNPEKSAI